MMRSVPGRVQQNTQFQDIDDVVSTSEQDDFFIAVAA
jgi:hypothetical protein